jgi:hypothetical protein
MARFGRTLTVNLVGRDESLQKTYKRVNKGSALMSDNLRKAARVGGIGLTALGGAAIGAAAMLKPMLDMAASVEESLSKNNVVFGESSALVEEFAETSLESFGVTRNAALEATGVIGTLGKAMGISEEESASMATTLVGLAGDMSSFNDASVEETLLAIQSGLRGEAEPLRRFGVLLDAATLKAKALEEGIINNTKSALTPQQKALAAYEVILDQTTIQMGDFERTADSATNTAKRLNGQWVEMQTTIGTALLPAYTALLTHLVEVVMPELQKFFDDPSWVAFGKLAGEALTSGFAIGTAKLLVGLASFVSSPAGFLTLQVKNAFNLFGRDTGDAYTDGLYAAITASGRDNPDWYRGDWDPTASGTADGTDYGEALAKAIRDALPENLFPEGGGMPGSGAPPPPVPDGAFPGMGPEEDEGGTPKPGPGSGGLFPGHTFPHLPPQTGVLGGSYTEFSPPSFTTGDELDAFYASLGITPSEPPPGVGHPAGPAAGQRGAMSMTVVVNGVSGKEVVDALGQYVDENGPLSSSLVA